MSNERKYSLDILRIIATILIVFHHYQQITGAFWAGRVNFFNGKFYFGYMVEFFFLLSGFFMYRNIDKVDNGINFRGYFLRRVLRLLPLVLISGVVYEIFLYCYSVLYGKSWFNITITIWGVIINALGIQDGWVFTNPCVNNPTWYISVLILCYVVFYLLTYISKKCNISHIYLYVFMILLGCGINTYGINLPFLNGSSSRGYYAFFFGLILAEILHNREIKNRDVIISLVSIIFLIYLIVYKFGWVSGGINYIMTFWFYPALVVLFSSKYFVKLFDFPIIGTLGKITYDVYIWHNPNFILMYIVIALFHLDVYVMSIKAMVVYTIISFLVGIASYLILEKPINRVISRKLAEMKI